DLFPILLTGLICLAGCATKLRAPINRMVSPETVGGAFNTELELSSLNQVEGKVDVSQSTPYPIQFSPVSSMGYFAALSMADSFDITWQHTASAPSMLGIKWQFLGGSLQSAGAGHSMALTAAIGGNEHEIDGNPKITFKVGATDYALIHGFWLAPFWQIFESVGYSHYTYDGELSGSPSGDFSESGKLLSLAAGTAILFKPFRIKTEISSVQADWSGMGKKSYLSWAFGLAYFF
ncbi:MAG: hypothetical protein K2P81_07335, partial [Bacteriovoracaceae bacterium]|nr:hypothetical protein [Bacteriovoracaceae bacterium]